ncbi:type I restriction-modification system subunit M [bacterium]|nr:type I restriction-modification system subunit M [bacterium]
MKDIDFENQLWQAADKLRGSMDASEYKHIVLGLIFLKYISEAFDKRKRFLEKATQDKNSPYYAPTPQAREAITEDKDSYLSQGIFYIPPEARWSYLQENATSSDIARKLDKAMELIEQENPQLKGVLPKIFVEYTRVRDLEPRILGELINLFSKIQEQKEKDKDLLGRIYEYFIGQFASAEGKRGGEFYTPRCLVKLLIEILEPYENCRVFDPACGSGGMFIQSRKFIEMHKKDPSKINFYGQEKNSTTWRLCQMNLAIRGIIAHVEQGDSYHNDKFPDLRADIVISNPPFNFSDWGADRIQKDPRIKYGLPPNSNANFMWIQHFVYHLAPGGVAGFVMANGALAVGGKEGEIRKRIIRDDLVDVIIACPPKLFYNVSLPVSLWFLTKDKRNKRFRDRRGETLFIDAREMYEPISRKQYVITDKQIQKIADTVRAWRGEKGAGKYKDEPGFCKAVTIEEIRKAGYVLTPGRYVGIKPEEDDGIPFEKKMKKLTKQLEKYFKESRKLERKIKHNLKRLGRQNA